MNGRMSLAANKYHRPHLLSRKCQYTQVKGYHKMPEDLVGAIAVELPGAVCGYKWVRN